GSTSFIGGALAFNADGTLVASEFRDGELTVFSLSKDGVAGTTQTIATGSYLAPQELAPISDGSFLLLAHDSRIKSEVFHVNSDLSLDESFNAGSGVATAPFRKSLALPSLGVLSDGRFYVGGIDTSNPGADYVARFLPDGTLDPVFGNAKVIASAPLAQMITPLADNIVVLTQAADSSIRLRKVLGGASLSLSTRGTLLVAGTSNSDT